MFMVLWTRLAKDYIYQVGDGAYMSTIGPKKEKKKEKIPCLYVYYLDNR